MDNLINYETNIFLIKASKKSFSLEIYTSIENKVKLIAEYFGFTSLPEHYRICIYVGNETELESWMLEKRINNIPTDSVAFAVFSNEIYVLDYECLRGKYSIDDYVALIVHECVHVLQGYFSGVNPSRYVWLYESVACYLADQKKVKLLGQNITWEIFTTDFYGIGIGCYGLAYEYGKRLFSYYSKECFLKVIKEPYDHINEFKAIYEDIYKYIRSMILECENKELR